MEKTIEDIRLDVFLVKNGYADSREKAKHLIKSGSILVDDAVVQEPSKHVNGNTKIKIIEGFKYVSRGGYKIDSAARHFGIVFEDKIIADIGCSKGGFTDYSLKRGAKRVYAIDTGDVLDKTLKSDSRVVYMPNTDARTIKELGETPDLCLVDVTFSTIESILSVAKNWLGTNGGVLGLIKPPFEGSGKVKKVRNYEECTRIAERIAEWARNNGYLVNGLVSSELKGKSSEQQEFFIYLIKK